MPQKSCASTASRLAVRNDGLNRSDGLERRLFLPLLRDLLFRRRLIT